MKTIYKSKYTYLILFLLSSVIIFINGCNNGPIAPKSSTLIFTEYLESTGNNKALELFNPTNIKIDLSDYSIVKYNSDSSNDYEELKIYGVLNPNETLVIVNSNADDKLKDKAHILTKNNVLNFDGNAKLELRFYDSPVDRIWFLNKLEGSNIKLIKKSFFKHGNIEKTSPSIDEWDYSEEIDDLSTFGSFE